jgi:hypothetical protein
MGSLAGTVQKGSRCEWRLHSGAAHEIIESLNRLPSRRLLFRCAHNCLCVSGFGVRRTAAFESLPLAGHFIRMLPLALPLEPVCPALAARGHCRDSNGSQIAVECAVPGKPPPLSCIRTIIVVLSCYAAGVVRALARNRLPTARALPARCRQYVGSLDEVHMPSVWVILIVALVIVGVSAYSRYRWKQRDRVRAMKQLVRDFTRSK